MSKPASARQAVRKAYGLLLHRLPGPRRTTVHDHLERVARIATALYRRWQVGPYQWRLKHLQWFLEVEVRNLEPSSRYRYWLTLRLLVMALNREPDWLPRLRGSWEHPGGTATARSGGRPIKRPT